MTAAISNHSPQITIHKGFRGTEILRRKIKGELAEIKAQIEHSGLSDQMTKGIELWRNQFSKAFELNQDGQKILDVFIPLLQDLLIDAFAQPLDENAVLGSDGRTYGHMSISLYINSAPSIYQNRSPSDPENQKPFSVALHPVVGHMISWLKKHHAEVHSEDLEKQYNLLAASHTLPPLPFATAAAPANDPQERIRQIFAKQAERERKKNLEMQLFISNLEKDKQTKLVTLQKNHEQIKQKTVEYEKLTSNTLQAVLDKDKGDLAQIERDKKKLKEEIEAIVQQNQELENQITDVENVLAKHKPVVADLVKQKAELQMQKILARQAERDRIQNAEMPNYSKGIQQIVAISMEEMRLGHEKNIQRSILYSKETNLKLDAIEKLDEKLLENLKLAKTKILNEISELASQNKDLENKLKKINSSADSIEAEDIRLRILINETHQAIKEREASGIMGLLTTIAIIGVCAFASWGISTLLAPHMSVAATPLSTSRGFQIGSLFIW